MPTTLGKYFEYFVNHSFSSLENYIRVLISTESTVLIRSGSIIFFVAVEVKV